MGDVDPFVKAEFKAPPKKLLDCLRDELRLRHYSIRTEEVYVKWARRYLQFHRQRTGSWVHPAQMGAAELRGFLEHLAVEGKVAASTQNQALNALIFLNEQVLKLPVATDAAKLTIGIRAEDVAVMADGPVQAVIHDVENHGVEKILTLRVGDQLLKATVPSQMQTSVDAAVAFRIDPDKAHFFDPATGQNLTF